MVEKLYFEDLVQGRIYASARAITLTREQIVAFGSEFDPHPGHIGEASAAQSAFGELVASGWHTAATSMRLITETTPIEGGGMGAGIELTWLRPVRPGDALHITIEVLSLRASESRPQWGIATFRTVTLNQQDQAVMEMISKVFLPRRTAVQV